MDRAIKTKSVEVDNDLSGDIAKIMERNFEKASPFMKLFWREQMKCHDSKSNRYHPMIITFYLAIASKSSSAYEELCKSGILCLPSKRTLCDYRNAIRPQTGFNPPVIEKLKCS